jgi:predicted ATP-grasp superfamily ATP-dependent carboligase
VLAVAREGAAGWVIFPTGDETAALVSRYHEELSGAFRLTTPPWSTFRWAYDKRLTDALAQSAGVTAPRTYQGVDPDDLDQLTLTYPVIVKPAVKTAVNAFTHAKAWRVGCLSELQARYAEACALVSPEIILIQELIPGGGEEQFSFAALCDHGEPLASLTARRTRQYPTDFGRASSFVETVDCPAVVDASYRLLAQMRFCGLIEIEFKRDPRDGAFKLLDLNPRVWGWHTLAGRVGIDFPYLAYQQALGAAVSAPPPTTGVGWLRVHTDVLAAVHDITHGRLSLLAYLRSLKRPLELSTLDVRDPVPCLMEGPLSLLIAARRRRL